MTDIFYRGDSGVIRPTAVTNQAGNIVDLTTLTEATFTMRRFEDSATVLLTKTLGAGVTVENPTGGILSVKIEAGDTDDISGNVCYDIEMIVDGETYTIKEDLLISKDVSH
jgi:hypothetical protein